MKKVTIRDVARAAGVSVATVSRAINGSDAVTPETQQRILEVIRTTGYQIPGGGKKTSAEDGLLYFIMKRASTNVYSALLNRQMILEAGKKGLTVVSANIETTVNRSSEEHLKKLRMASPALPKKHLLRKYSNISGNAGFRWCSSIVRCPSTATTAC